jgi:hypothetical protein
MPAATAPPVRAAKRAIRASTNAGSPNRDFICARTS